jgi:predicted small lipoprotein YifL
MSVRIKALTLTVLFGATAALAACGKQGTLEQPRPIFGSVPQSAAGSKEENMDPASNGRSQREAPLPGTSNPFGTPRPSTVTQ